MLPACILDARGKKVTDVPASVCLVSRPAHAGPQGGDLPCPRASHSLSPCLPCLARVHRRRVQA
eukprot:54067-Eustigmatos_ZCMA.PRE.1